MRRTWTALLLCACALPVAAHVGSQTALDVQRARLTGTQADVDALLIIADLERRQGRWDLALDAVNEAAAWFPDDARVSLQRGLTHAAAGNDPEALADLTRHLEAGGDAVAALETRAAVLERLGRRDEALRDWQAAVERAPTPDNVLARGRVQVALGQWTQAARDYEEALIVLTGAVVVQQALLDVELHLGRHDRAIGRINAIMAPLPVKSPWLLRRADVEDAAGRQRKARADRMIALRELDQLVSRRGSPNQLLLRARCRWQLGDAAGARQDLARVIEIQPGAPGSLELQNLFNNRSPHP